LSHLQQEQKVPTIIHWDNMSAIAMTKNPIFQLNKAYRGLSPFHQGLGE